MLHIVREKYRENYKSHLIRFNIRYHDREGCFWAGDKIYHLFFPATHKDKQACNKITACLGHQEHLNNKLCLASIICDPPSLTFRLKKKQKQGWMMDGWLVGALKSKLYVHSCGMPFGRWDCVVPKITSNLSIVA